MGALKKDFIAAAVIMAVILGVIVLFRPSSKISFLDVRVVNDTHKVVTIQGCWDPDCIDIHGLKPQVIHPGGSVDSTGRFATDVGGEVSVAIRKPGGGQRQFSGCLVAGYAAGQKVLLMHVSHARPCLTTTEP